MDRMFDSVSLTYDVSQVVGVMNGVESLRCPGEQKFRREIVVAIHFHAGNANVNVSNAWQAEEGA